MNVKSRQLMEVTVGGFPSAPEACDYCFGSFTKTGVPPAGPVAPACVCMSYPDGAEHNMFCATPVSAAAYVKEKGGCLCQARDMESMGQERAVSALGGAVLLAVASAPGPVPLVGSCGQRAFDGAAFENINVKGALSTSCQARLGALGALLLLRHWAPPGAELFRQGAAELRGGAAGGVDAEQLTAKLAAIPTERVSLDDSRKGLQPVVSELRQRASAPEQLAKFDVFTGWADRGGLLGARGRGDAEREHAADALGASRAASDAVANEVTAKLAHQGRRAQARPAVEAGPGAHGHGGPVQLAPRERRLGAFGAKGGFDSPPGRASDARFAGVVPGGVTRFNECLRVSEGLSDFNRKVLQAEAKVPHGGDLAPRCPVELNIGALVCESMSTRRATQATGWAPGTFEVLAVAAPTLDIAALHGAGFFSNGLADLVVHQLIIFRVRKARKAGLLSGRLRVRPVFLKAPRASASGEPAAGSVSKGGRLPAASARRAGRPAMAAAAPEEPAWLACYRARRPASQSRVAWEVPGQSPLAKRPSASRLASVRGRPAGKQEVAAAWLQGLSAEARLRAADDPPTARANLRRAITDSSCPEVRADAAGGWRYTGAVLRAADAALGIAPPRAQPAFRAAGAGPAASGDGAPLQTRKVLAGSGPGSLELWWSDFEAAARADLLAAQGITHRLNVAAEVEKSFRGHEATMVTATVPMVDAFDDADAEDNIRVWVAQLGQVMEVLRGWSREGAVVNVNCQMGKNRSGAALLIWLCQACGWGLVRAVEHLRGITSLACGNPHMMKAVCIFLGSSESVPLNPAGDGGGWICVSPPGTPRAGAVQAFEDVARLAIDRLAAAAEGAAEGAAEDGDDGDEGPCEGLAPLFGELSGAED
ncbi:unnamed protein product [Prorocentrum cordatum]|uniref:Dual specificity phosphatase catalytic domain-containing protein n=1 Tax=Prorocentrum cordatum TaxID=2364126 RepID=A0ABN9PAJ7_9DINO|nr:unnamed protein product [Polarella glacialis]